MPKPIHIQYFAILREERGVSDETLTTSATTATDLYLELQEIYDFSLSSKVIRVAINNQFCPWETILKSGDHVVFIPPVAGG